MNLKRRFNLTRLTDTCEVDDIELTNCSESSEQRTFISSHLTTANFLARNSQRVVQTSERLHRLHKQIMYVAQDLIIAPSIISINQITIDSQRMKEMKYYDILLIKLPFVTIELHPPESSQISGV